MSILIYDTEIKYGVATPDNPPQPGYHYAQGWTDFTGMGIAVIGVWDAADNRPRVFCDDNLPAWLDLVAQRDWVVSFNGHRFDDPLLKANGAGYPAAKSLDLAALIWVAADIPWGQHPEGLSLNAICQANNLPTKTGNGADAPQLWQDGKTGTVIDYCLADVLCTVALFQLIYRDGWITDPRNGNRLPIQLPF